MEHSDEQSLLPPPTPTLEWNEDDMNALHDAIFFESPLALPPSAQPPSAPPSSAPPLSALPPSAPPPSAPPPSAACPRPRTEEDEEEELRKIGLIAAIPTPDMGPREEEGEGGAARWVWVTEEVAKKCERFDYETSFSNDRIWAINESPPGKTLSPDTLTVSTVTHMSKLNRSFSKTEALEKLPQVVPQVMALHGIKDFRVPHSPEEVEALQEELDEPPAAGAQKREAGQRFPSFSNAMIMVIQSSDPKKNNIAVKFFFSGVLHVTGCKSAAECMDVANLACDVLNHVPWETSRESGPLAYRVVDFTVQLINTNFSVPFQLKLPLLYGWMHKVYAHMDYSFDPQMHAALIIKVPVTTNAIRRNVTVMAFDSGNILISGAIHPYEVSAGYGFIMKFLYQTHKNAATRLTPEETKAQLDRRGNKGAAARRAAKRKAEASGAAPTPVAGPPALPPPAPTERARAGRRKARDSATGGGKPGLAKRTRGGQGRAHIVSY